MGEDTEKVTEVSWKAGNFSSRVVWQAQTKRDGEGGSHCEEETQSACLGIPDIAVRLQHSGAWASAEASLLRDPQEGERMIQKEPNARGKNFRWDPWGDPPSKNKPDTDHQHGGGEGSLVEGAEEANKAGHARKIEKRRISLHCPST